MLDLHEMDSLPLAAHRRSAGKDKCFHLNHFVLVDVRGAVYR
jgi:hypothetical protein